MSKMKNWRAVWPIILMGIATTNCYIGWMPETELGWSMWAGNLVLGIVALVLLFRQK